MEIFLLCVALCAVVALTVVVLSFLRHDEHRLAAQYREKSMSEIMPNRLQAYERMALFLERISPEAMVLREQPTTATAGELHTLMVNQIRQELEHNVAMQIYVSAGSWQRIMRAKEEVVKELNEVAKTIDPKATSLQYGVEVIEAARNGCVFYVNRALEGLRKDVEGEFVKP